MKKSIKKIFRPVAALLTATMLLSSCGKADYRAGNITPHPYTAPVSMSDKGEFREMNADSFTLMVYICGSNLESNNGCATTDLNEMLYGDIGGKLNIIAQTGGTRKWQNNFFSSNTVERYALDEEGITRVDDCGMVEMTNSNTLADFIKFSKENFPADRYGFIFWDHGGGTLGGYGGDENFGNSTMSIAEIADGLEAGGCHFDFIGFDCCLMATVETASAIAPYANYMIASEESEPGSGWYYTNFVSQISADPSVSVPDIAYTILSDYIDSDNTIVDGGVTLSLVDLRKIDNVLSALYTYLDNSRTLLLDGYYKDLSTARSSARSFGEGYFDQIDIIDYISRLEIDGAQELYDAINEAVIYNATNLSGSNGLAMYYPYSHPGEYADVAYFIDDIGIASEYSDYFDDFVSVMAGGQQYGGSDNPYTTFEDPSSDWLSELWDWFNTDIVSEYEDNYSYVESDTLMITPKGDGYVLSLSDEDWEIVTDMALEVLADDGEGYLALGMDNLFEFDSDGDLIVDYDYTWLYLNDSLVSYYHCEVGEFSDGTSYSLGYVPAILNNMYDIYIWIVWDNESGVGTILGYEYDEDYGVAQKGYFDFEDGDVIDFYFDYYTYDGEFDDSYFLNNNELVFSWAEGITLSYDYIGDVDTEICFWLLDIYGNEYWTEPLSITIK